jgi:hypothetical protein
MNSFNRWSIVLFGLAGLGLCVACETDSAATLPDLRPDSAVERGGSGDEPPPDAALGADGSLAGDDDAAAPSELLRMVGAVEDSDIRLGVVADDRRARLFFCGGPTSYATATQWIIVDLDADGNFDDVDLGVSGRLRPDSLRGQRSVDGEEHAFDARPVRSGTLAGLYEGTAECGRVGLIVTQNAPDDEASAQGACVKPGRPAEQVHPILPVAQENGEIRVEVAGAESRVREAAAAM